MEGDRVCLNNAGLGSLKTDCVTGQETGTAIDDQSASAVETEQHEDISSFSADPSMTQSGKKEEKSPSKMSVVSNAVADENKMLTQQENDEEKTSETVESPDHQDTLNAATFEQETPTSDHQTPLSQQSLDETESWPVVTANLLSHGGGPHIFEFSGRESDVDEKTSESFVPGSDVDGNMAVRNMQKTEKKNDNYYSSFDSNKGTSVEPDHAETGQVQIKEQPAESQVHGSAEVDCQDMICFSIEQSELETTDDQACNERPTASEAKTGTGYLDSVISSMQSLPCKQPDADTVKISRAELTLMVEQTLAAQTMCNYMQDLVQKNKTLNKQNEVLKDTIMQTRKWEHGGGEDKDNPSSLPFGQVFRFPGTLPQVPDQGDPGSLYQTDSDLQSASVQLSSHICLDGDNSLNRDTSAAGKAHGPLVASTSAASGSWVPASGASLLPNIPHETLLEGAQCYSLGPQQYEESVVGSSAGMSPEQFKRALDELEKTKLFLHKISREGGVHPDSMQELVNLRGKVQSFQDENSKLKMELENKPENDMQTKNRSLEEKLRDQKRREDDLLKQFAKLGAENKRLRRSGGSRPPSQPPSSVGLPALPHISPDEFHSRLAKLNGQLQEACYPWLSAAKKLLQYKSELAHQTFWSTSQHTRELQSKAQSKEEESAKAVKNLDHSMRFLHKENQDIKRYCDELKDKVVFLTRENEAHKRRISLDVERISQLEAEVPKGHLSQEAEMTRHQEMLAQEVEINKRKLSQELVRNKQLEEMINDERKRYSRDEKELLDRVRMLSREVESLRRLVLAVEQARREGSPVPQEWASQLATLSRRQQDQGSSRGPPSTSASSSGPRASGPASGSRLPQMASGSGHPAAPVSRGAGQQRASPGGPGGERGGGSLSSAMASPPQAAVAPHSSLWSAQQLGANEQQQYPGQSGWQGSQGNLQPQPRSHPQNSASSAPFQHR